MKILFVSGKYFPVFNEKDLGAIEKLEQIYIKYNQSKNDEITVYSPKISKTNYDKLSFKNCQFRIIDKTTISYFFEKVLYFFKLKIFKEKAINPYIKHIVKDCEFRIIDKTTLSYFFEKVLYFFKLKFLKEKAINPYIKHIVKDLKNRNQENYFDLIIFENELDSIKYLKDKTNTNTKMVLHLHNDYLNKDTKNFDEIVKHVDQIWAVSDYIQSRVLEKNTTLNIKVLYNTYSKDFSSEINENKRKELYNKFELDNKFVFIFVGRIVENKGVKELVEAFTEFNEKYENTKLLVVGQPDKNKNGQLYYKQLRKISNENVIFTGFIEPKEIRTYYSLANAQIIPTTNWESFGIVLLEGMYNNLKIIANDVGALREIGKDKIIYTDKNNLIKSLVEKMEMLYNDNTNLPDDYYKDILNNYSEKIFCENIYMLIHNFENN